MFNALCRGGSCRAPRTLTSVCSDWNAQTWKANCLQIFALGALTSVKMWTTRGKNLAKSLTEQRKKLGQESGKQETSSHLSWCQNELRQLSWGNVQNLGKTHQLDYTLKDLHLKAGAGRATHPFHFQEKEFVTKATGTFLCTFHWVRSWQEHQMTVLSVARVTALETIQKNTTHK